MLNRHAKAQTFDLVDIGHISEQGVHYQIGASIGHSAAKGIEIGKLSFVVAASTPFQRAQIHRISHAKILEGTQQLAVNGLRQTYLRRYAMMEVGQNAFAVHTLRGSGQAQQNFRVVVGQQFLIGGRRCVMKLVHYDIVIKIRGGLCGKILGIERLNGNKQMVDTLRLIIAHEQLTEVGILQHRSKGIQTLSQNFFPVSNEKQPMGLSGILLAKPFIIQCRNHRLARTGGSYHQVAGISSDGSLRLQLIQNFLLVGVGRDIHGIDCGIVGINVLLCFQCPSQPFLLTL